MDRSSATTLLRMPSCRATSSCTRQGGGSDAQGGESDAATQQGLRSGHGIPHKHSTKLRGNVQSIPLCQASAKTWCLHGAGGISCCPVT